MASFTSRLAGWTAGRLKGEKARKRTMDWMQKTGLGQALSFAGDAALVGGAMKGAGALKALLKGGAQAGTAAAVAPTAITKTSADARNLLASIGDDTGLVSQALGRSAALPPEPFQRMAQAAATPKPTLMSRIGAAGQRVGEAMLKRPEIPMAIGQTILGAQQGQQEQQRFEQQFAVNEEERKRQREAQEALARMLMPLFQSEVQRYGQSQRG